RVERGELLMDAVVCSVDGAQYVRQSASAPVEQAAQLGEFMAGGVVVGGGRDIFGEGERARGGGRPVTRALGASLDYSRRRTEPGPVRALAGSRCGPGLRAADSLCCGGGEWSVGRSFTEPGPL